MAGTFTNAAGNEFMLGGGPLPSSWFQDRYAPPPPTPVAPRPQYQAGRYQWPAQYRRMMGPMAGAGPMRGLNQMTMGASSPTPAHVSPMQSPAMMALRSVVSHPGASPTMQRAIGRR